MPGKRATAEVIDARRGEVEQVMLSGNWTLRAQGALATRHGVSARQIREDAKLIRKGWAEEAEGITTEDARADWMARLRSAQAQAKGNNQPVALAKLLALEARACGHMEPVRVQVDHGMGDPRQLAASVLDALPMVYQVLGLPAPEVPQIVDADCVDSDPLSVE